MTDDPKTFWQKLAKFYALRQWLNIPVMLVLLPFLVAGVLARGLVFYLRGKLRRPLPGAPWSVVSLSHVYWNHVWQRNHHTMSRLAANGHPVLYMTPVYLHIAARWPGAVINPVSRNPVPPGVTTSFAPMIPGGSRFACVDRLNAWLLAAEAAGRGFAGNTVLWFYYPAHESIRRTLRHRAVIYDIQDEYSAFSWSSASIARAEKRLLDTCDVTFPGTYALFEKKRPANGVSRFFACGVDVDHFAAPPKVPVAVPARKDGSRPFRLGFFGAIDSRIDGSLLEKMADAHPEWDIFMLGPVARQQFVPAERPNLHFTGPIAYADLPAHLHSWDVALMPWAVNELTMHINPTKTLEYLASSKPVVSTSLPDLEQFYHSVVYLASSHEQFIRFCEDIQSGRLPEAGRIEAGAALARKNSWQSVVAEMISLVDQAIGKRVRGAIPNA
ncbi:glycosyltransferase [Candidatus Poribacteria bacterium]|nr:glycosyltransferase [Candidatus Poribacteria bacterium]